jgi:HK97 family phage portal protein
MGKFKEIIHRTKEIFGRIFSPGSKKWLQSGSGGFLDILPGYGGGFDVYKSFAYACINARAENICKAKIYLYKDEPGRRDKEIIAHPFLDLIAKPNRRNQTFREILFKIAVSLDLYGNSYVFIQRGKDGSPAGLYHLPSKYIDIKLNDSQTEISHYVYNAGGKLQKFEKNNIIHFLIPDPDNNYKGKSTIEGFNLTLEIDYLQNLYQRNYYRNNAAPGIIIELNREMMDAEFERFKTKFRAMYEGAGNTGKTLLLDNGAKAKTFRSIPKDVEILKARTWVRDEIMSIFRVPKIILGVTTDVNRANAVQQLRTFNDNVIKPFAKLTIESKFNSFLQNNYVKENLRLSMEYDFENDRELQLRAYELYMRYGIVSKDEIREMEGF